MAKDDLTARKAELYEAYDEAALRILLDRYEETRGEALLAEEEALLSRPEYRAPGDLDRKMARTLEDCVRRKQRERRGKQALSLGARAAIVILALGAVLLLSGVTARAAGEAARPGREESAFTAPAEEEIREQEKRAEEADFCGDSRGNETDETEREAG